MALNLSPEDIAALDASIGAAVNMAVGEAFGTYFATAQDFGGAVLEAGGEGVDISAASVAAIGDEFDRRNAKVAAASDESAIVGNDGPWYWTVASVKYLPPGRRFLGERSRALCRTDAERALVDLNCGFDAAGNPTGKFGDGFAQSDSNLTPRLQNAFTSMVHPVIRSWFGLGLDRTRTVRQSDDGFPLDFACRGITPQEEAEWCRLTGEHIKYTTGAWKN